MLFRSVDVYDDSPASKAGLKANDIIKTVDEKQASIKSLIPKTPRGQALGVSQSLPRARGRGTACGG